MRSQPAILSILALALISFGGGQQASVDPASAMHWRAIGPTRAGAIDIQARYHYDDPGDAKPLIR